MTSVARIQQITSLVLIGLALTRLGGWERRATVLRECPPGRLRRPSSFISLRRAARLSHPGKVGANPRLIQNRLFHKP